MLAQTLEQLGQFYDSIYEIQMTYRLETLYPKVVLFLFITIPPIIPAVTGGSSFGRLSFDWGIYLRTLIERIAVWTILLVGFWFFWRLLMQFPPLRGAWDRVKLVIPWIGGIVRRTCLARWSRAMAMLLRAGVPLRRGLDAAASATGNEAMAASMRSESSRVISGEPLSAVMAHSGEFPEQAIDMVMTGERSGNIEGMLDKTADYYQAEAAVANKQTAIIVGVAFYLLVALMVGVFVVTFWSGYFSGVLGQFDAAFK